MGGMGAMGALEELNLNSNQMGDAGMQAFADAIGSGPMGVDTFSWVDTERVMWIGVDGDAVGAVDGNVGRGRDGMGSCGWNAMRQDEKEEELTRRDWATLDWI